VEIKTEDQIEKGLEFLENECDKGYKCFIGNLRNMINPILSPKEVGSSLLILGSGLKNRSDMELTKKTIDYCKTYQNNGKYAFFKDNSLPPDTDVTSWALSTLFELNEIDEKIVSTVVEKILFNVNEKGLIKIYFEPCNKKNRIDHVGIANALYLIYLFNRERKAIKSENFLFEVLSSKEYLKGSHYYHSPDMLLYSLSKTMKFPTFNKKFGELLRSSINERIGSTEWPLDLAMRISVAKKLDIDNETDKKKLLNLQNDDGSWPIDAIYHYGRKNGFFGSKSISTSFAIEALK